jgi:hypothetical protein
MLWNLCVRLWNDESGAVIATEYLMLGSIVALGSASGMAAMRDSVIEEYKDMGQGIHDTRQAYTVKGARGASSNRGGSAVTNGTVDGMSNPNSQAAHFSCPNP